MKGQSIRRAVESLELLAGATDMNGSTLYDVDEALAWDAKREVWVGSDGFAHDGARLRRYPRAGGGA